MLVTQRKPRRGILLLVVMALLALMATVTMTFVLVTGVQMRAARTTALADLEADSPEDLIDGAMDQVLRGAEDPSSPLWTHSLLGDVYGDDIRLGVNTGEIASPSTDLGAGAGGLVQLFLKFDNIRSANTPFHPSDVLGFYDGRLITMVTGPAAGVSRRIVRSITTTGGAATYTVHVQSFGNNSTAALPQPGDKFIINDRPFDGTGFGLGLAIGSPLTPDIADGTFDPTITHTLTIAGKPLPRAFLPNHSSIAYTNAELFDSYYPDPAGLGGADEDYDAADYQNMHMAVIVADPNTSGTGPIQGTKVIRPSYHDPALITYWENEISTDAMLAAASDEEKRNLRRKYFFRPYPEDHPDFPVINPITGPWDVDNDGDGKTDSIWIDLGSPVQTDASGRQYKPLYAILCLDMDGRLNLNAHGSPMHLVRNSGDWPRKRFVGPFADRMGEALLPFGQGYGPADIVLNDLFVSGTAAGYAPAYEPHDLFFLLHGKPDKYFDGSNVKLAGRYGEEYLLPGYNSGLTNVPMPGRTTRWDTSNDGDWGISGEDDDLDGNAGNITERTFNQLLVSNEVYDDNFPTPPVKQVDRLNDPSLVTSQEYFRGNAAAYNPQSDYDGDGTVVLDVRGNPLHISYGEDDDAIDEPYEMDLTRSNSGRRMSPVVGSGVSEADAPFTPADLEALLRINDADVGTLYSRLLELAGDTFVRMGTDDRRAFLRALVTTESWDSPTAASMVGMPEETKSPFSLRGADLLINRLADADIGGTYAGSFDNELRKGFAPLLMDGLKVDLNRAFGNSADDDGTATTNPGYGVIDEPGDGVPNDSGVTNSESLWNDPVVNGVLFDYDNNGRVDRTNRAAVIKEANRARQAMARHLYILAMALRNRNAPDASPGITAREIAQWAINVVDFRDFDSIMTAFEYDEEPFDSDGWSVDGDLSTTTESNRQVVWGVERPELLITETIAGHDRGTDDDAANGGTVSSGDMGTNYDQVARPEGWVAIELYNPQSAMTPQSAELYDEFGLELSATVGNVPTGSPVWRMAFGKPDTGSHPQFDPDYNQPTASDYEARHNAVLNLDAAAEAGDMGNIERTVYFTNNAPTNGDAGVEYYRTGGKVSIGPGRYAVIATQGVEANGTPVTAPNNITVGRNHNGGMGRPRLNLEVVGLPAENEPNWLTVESDGMTDPYPTYSYSTTDEIIQAPISVVIDKPYDVLASNSQRFSISEPVAGYPNDPMNLAAMPDDNPWDQTANEPWFNAVNALPEYETHNIGAYNRVYLQRLANPMLAYNAVTNPYITVDSMPLDLWVYNSSADEAATAAMSPGAEEPGNIRSRERIGNAANADTHDGESNIWRQWAGDENTGLNAAPTSTAKLQHTLGYLNSVWHLGAPSDHRWWTPKRFQTDNPEALGNGVLAHTGIDENYYTGAPLVPAPWLTWNNRPFISKYELMMVPKSSPAELLAEYSLRDTTTGIDIYGNATEESEYSSDYNGKPVTHLLNFFHTSDKTGGVSGSAPNDLYRIFEFVDVPSRFSGLSEMLRPSAFNATTGTATNNIFGWDQNSPPQRNFSPPFNYLSKFREPGKVNINTVFDDGSTWKALLGGFANYAGAPSWDKVQQSRRGYSYGTPILNGMGDPNLNPSQPSLIARPFRSFSGGYFAPTTALQHEGIESTLLRSDPDPAVTPKQPLFALSSASANIDTDKNPNFRYQLLNRLSNMVTTRSNVYAVWITVGYFEVEPVDKQDYITNKGYSAAEVDRVFPDGYRLKGELGSDTGDIERHRGFYLVDRLVPVAYERGKTHNTRKTIRLRTIIE